MVISKQQYQKLPDDLKKYFILGGDESSDGLRKNIHPT